MPSTLIFGFVIRSSKGAEYGKGSVSAPAFVCEDLGTDTEFLRLQKFGVCPQIFQIFHNRCFWSVWFMVFLNVVPAVAQTQASISGVIHDPTGAVIPGVTVTVTNPATNFVRTAISKEAGVYN